MRAAKFLKGVSIGLIAALSVSVFAGCNTAKKTDESASPKTNTSTEAKPLKFTISMTDGLIEYIKKSPDINQDKWIKEFNKRFNTEMTVRFLDHKKLLENMQIMFASGDIPDIVTAFDNYLRADLAGSVENGIYMPLDDLLAKNKASLPNLMNAIPKSAWEEMKYEGKTYGIPSVYLSVPARRATYIRKDLLDKFGLKIPKTMDEFVEVLRVFKKNGVKYPYAGREKWDYTDIFFGTFGVYKSSWNVNKEGQLIPDMIAPEMKTALKFHADLRKEGLMDPESLTTNGTDWNNKIFSGNVGVFDHNANSMATWVSGIKANVPTAELALIPSPIGPGGPGGKQGMFKYSSVNQTIYINKNFKEPERFLKLLDKLATPEAQEFFNFGIEGDTYTKKDGKIQFTYPTDSLKSSELSYRRFLSLVRDEAYNKDIIPYMPNGTEMLDWFTNVGPKEGLSWVDPGNLKSLKDHPDLKPGNCDLFYEYAAKIFFGQQPADAFDDFVKEYMKRGGDQIVKEATEAYKAGKVLKR